MAGAVILLFIAAMATWRVYMGSHAGEMAMANFSPIGAMALFGGAYFSRSKALIFPLLTLWLSDIMLNRFLYFGEWVFFYDGFLWVYGAFALMVFAGRWMKPNKGVGRFVGASVAIVFIHWIVTDIGVWLSSPMYPLTLEGLWLCLVAAIPFELNLLAGTLAYGVVMFGLFEWSARSVPSLKSSEIT
ncbi:hypothetical protein DYD21_11905 [Rhodohalobacter sp. SW132]|nr:hypothetical protein DYD21_11905 [Rhodohalobacter sp. SW132]